MHCENFVKNYLPSIKARIVKVLYTDHELNQEEISKILEITQPAVSQYIREERGTEELSRSLAERSDGSAHEIFELYKEEELTDEALDDIWCELCHEVRDLE